MKAIKIKGHLTSDIHLPDDMPCDMNRRTPSIFETGVVKKLILLASETLITMGVFLQNICLPSMEETIAEYRQKNQKMQMQNSQSSRGLP